MAWTPPTFADAGGTGTSTCAGCRRSSPADMLFDVRAIAGDVAIPRGADFICCGCRETLFRKGFITKADYMVAVGAPPELVARYD
jgi:hypothetical protein